MVQELNALQDGLKKMAEAGGGAEEFKTAQTALTEKHKAYTDNEPVF